MTKKEGNLKRVIITLLLGFAVVNFWRGIWGLMDIYLFPSNQILSFTISVIIGIIIVYSIKHQLKILR